MVRERLPAHGWLGLGLVGVFWPLNWMLEGPRTHWGFFPLWLGYCLTVDAVNLRRSGTSLLTRSGSSYAGLFLISVPLWWLFEVINARTGNWIYVGGEHLSDLQYALLASLSFSTVAPAVLGTAELVAGLGAVQRLAGRRGFRADRRTAGWLLGAGLAMLVLTLAWPLYFFPLVWVSLVLVVDPINFRLGHRSLLEWAGRGDWRPVGALGLGALICGFFWEMWNFYSYPKWTYRVPGLGFWPLFEMPVLGYLGYLPFALEVFAIVQLFLGVSRAKELDYVLTGLTGRAPY
jgi:hypothetical protein